MTTPTAGGPTAEIVPFPLHAITLPSCAIEPPRIGGTLRALVGGRAIEGLIDEQPCSAIQPELAEHLRRTERVMVYFPTERRCAYEFWLPVIGLARSVRVVEWPGLNVPLIFGSRVLKAPLAVARDLPSATVLPFLRRQTLGDVVAAGARLTIGRRRVRYALRPDQPYSEIADRWSEFVEEPARVMRDRSSGERALEAFVTVRAPAPVRIRCLFRELGDVDLILGSDALGALLPDPRRPARSRSVH